VKPPPYAAVYFDCDSTLSAIEGVDELAHDDPELRAASAALTEQAMAGTLPLDQVYGARLRALAPRREQVEQLGALYVARAVPDAAAVVAALQACGKHVGIVSGGFAGPVGALARHLGVPDANVHAVRLDFAADGSYAGYDEASPLARNGGKAEVLRALPDAHHPLAFVGDGITDAETRGHVACFVGFGGVAARPAVRATADVWVEGPGLAAVLRHVLSPGELARLRADERFAALAGVRR
jgi:phosphoserine phosphatase